MKFKFLFIISAIFISTGCDKFLDIVPKDKFIPVTVDDYENMLNNATLVNFGDYFQDLLTDDAFLPEGEPGNLFTKQQIHGRRIYTFNKNVFDERSNDFLWSEGYKRIFYFNTIINNIMDAKGKTENYKKSVKAEALFGRALEHLQLVNVYAQHYDATTASTEPGVPIALIADISAKFERNTVQQVYDQVISDLNEALQSIPLQPKITKFRASKPATYALLARTYLYMGDYEKALVNAQLALELEHELYDMNDYQVIIPGPFPYVPGAPLGWTNIPDGQHNPETLAARHFLRPFGLGMDVCASPELSALFTNDDRRWVLYYANGWPPAPPFNYMNRYGVKIFLRGEYYNNAIGLPEVYLIAAEAKARMNDLAGALNDINELRKHRIAPVAYVEYAPVDFDNDEEKVLRFVLDERRRELAFTGLRHIDLKRLNKEARFQKTITHVAEGVEYTLLPNSTDYLRQIWPAASAFNPDWTLNP